MDFTSVLAQATVSDAPRAEAWYSALFGRGPDTRPMDGLVEWHVGGGRGVQVWVDPVRAGRSTVVLGTDDVDGVTSRLGAAGIAQDGPEPAGAGHVLRLQDPDGNTVVVTGA
ncbi:VOC family protein [Blastococcus sp. SYSU D00669]